MNINILDTIKGKSDQLNVVDVVGGELMITIEGVNLTTDSEQPWNVFYYGGDVPWKPSLNMRRIIIKLWGEDYQSWGGRVVNLYIDPDVDYGKQKGVGGLRINALSHINCIKKMKLPIRRGMLKEYTIHPIQLSQE